MFILQIFIRLGNLYSSIYYDGLIFIVLLEMSN